MPLHANPVVPTAKAAAALRPAKAELTGGLLADRVAANQHAIPLGKDRLEQAGALGNLRRASDPAAEGAEGLIFHDSDVHKWAEAAAWEYGRTGDETLLAHLDEVANALAAAQCDDGYLNSVHQLRRLTRYADLGRSHEHYCAGHLMQAAVAMSRTSGHKEMLAVAERLADHLDQTFGPGKSPLLDGHPVVEMALVELYRETGTRRYLDLAKHFVDTRGHGHATAPNGEPSYYSDRVAVRDAQTVEGHSVRAVYLAAGATDVAVETQDAELLAAVRHQFDAMRREKQYVTGGIGSRWDWEAFGDPHELPPDRAYAETCAAIGSVQWAWRLLLATGEAQYADHIEHVLYNGVLPGVSLSGGEYFYVNTLQQRSGAQPDHNRSTAHGRRGWFECACCPPNVMRTLANLPAMLATATDDGLQVHLYGNATLGTEYLTVEVETNYPWDGEVTVRVVEAPAGDAEIALRVPEWADGATLDGEPVAAGDYARVRRTFGVGDTLRLSLPMRARVLVADDRVDAVRGCVAVLRGPLVYAAEQPDQPAEALVDDLRIDPRGRFAAEHRDAVLGGVTVLRAEGAVGEAPDPAARSPYREYDGATTPSTPIELTLIPYFAWANRGVQAMRVWIPTT